MGRCVYGPMYAHRYAHFLHVCVWGDDFFSKTERESVNDFVEIVTVPYMYMSIVRYGLFCIGQHCNSLCLL